MLPHEILIKILGDLSNNELKGFLVICQEWRDIIIKNPSTMRKLPLVLKKDTWREKMDFLEKYGEYVKDIKFDECAFQSMSDIHRILSLTPSVEKLKFLNCYLKNEESNDEPMVLQVSPPNPADIAVMAQIPDQDADMEPDIAVLMEDPVIREAEREIRAYEANFLNIRPEGYYVQNANASEVATVEEPTLELSKLKILELDSPAIAQRLIKYFETSKEIEIMKITFYYQEPAPEFTDFLCQQEKLKDLVIHGWSEMVLKSLFATDISERIKFKLSRLAIEWELLYNLHFSKFLKTQLSLKEFEMHGYSICFCWYRIIFNDMKALKKLTISVDWFLTDDRAQQIKTCSTPTLEDLRIVGTNDDPGEFSAVINIFPNLKKLWVENLMYYHAGCLEKFERLEQITIDNFRIESVMFVKFKCLKVLEVNYLYPFGLKILWENFAKNNSALKRLIIRDIGNFKLIASIKEELSTIVRCLEHFTEIELVEIIHNHQEPIVNGDENDADAPIRHNGPPPFFKIVVERFQKYPKVLRVSRYFAENCVQDFEYLKDLYKEHEIIVV